MKNITTMLLGRGYTCAALADSYELLEDDGYIRALSREDDAPDLLVYVTARKLSEKENNITRVSRNAVDKLMMKASRAGDILACVSFCVCKNSYDDVEVVIVPIEEIEARAERGGIFSKSDRGVFFDFSKETAGRKPEGALIKCEFSRRTEA